MDTAEKATCDVSTQGRDLVWKLECKNSQINNGELCLAFYLLFLLCVKVMQGTLPAQVIYFDALCGTCEHGNHASALFLRET